jgi:multidrug transporter EmrE-like cation transporter
MKLLIALLTNSLANIFVKLGASSYRETGSFSSFFFHCLKNFYIWLGLLFFGLSFVFYSLSLTKTKLSTAYPIMTGAGFIIVTAASILLFKENISFLKIVGILLIATGIWLVSVT